MISRAPDSSSKSKKVDGVREGEKGLVEKLSRLKQQILDSRAESIREKLEENGRSVATISKQLELASTGIDSSVGQRESENLLSVRKKHSLCRLNGSAKGVGEKENISINAQEELSSSSIIILGNTSGGKCAVHTIKLPRVETIPRYTSWIFIGRNQRMADDQSVLGRRQIYYDQHGSETLICSDSEGELIEPEEEKHNFSDGEDQLLWKALHEHGSSPEIFNILRQFIDATTFEIEERYEILLKKHQVDDTACSGPSSENASEKNLLDKTLASAMDSFDNLFCRRCLVFDCRPHGCSQNLVLPSEKMPFLMDPEDCEKPCGNECYLQQGLYQGLHSSKFLSTSTPQSEKLSVSQDVKSSDACCKNEDLHSGGLTSAIKLHVDISATPLTNKGKRKTLEPENSLKENKRHISEIPLDTYKKNLLNEKITVNAENQQEMHRDSLEKTEHLDSGVYRMQENMESFQIDSELDASPGPGDINKESHTQKVEAKSLAESPALNDQSDLSKSQCSKTWHPLEKDLYLKGVEIFGKNSCLIARNLLAGLKTCMEVAEYMFNDCINTPDNSFQAKSENEANAFHFMEQERPARTRILRRRGRARKLKYTWKSAGNSSVRKRIADGRERCKQYIPCECQHMCSKQCPCVENGNCCEKYCGCSKSCKNRFRGCHCAKSQCRSRQCPCFAAGRECDPDVCRNCWVSCGDGSLGSPPSHGDGYQCGNMKLLLKQQQRILLGRSDVAGWGAFIKNPVNKNDYLGEYTGELISHKEADKRGKIYDRANSSFLFDLNDEFVLDACRKGDKLKFANHSSNPNCYAKIMLVAGDHRVGIFSKEHIDATEELFYDYRYGPDEAPSWARKPEGSKKDDPLSHTRRAHKAA